MIFINSFIVHKSGGGAPQNENSVPDSAALEKINRYTRRSFTAEELYVFPVALCDNEIDRDGERFSVPALQKLAELFVGKTGVFDHDPKAQNQTARIFDCRVRTDPARGTSTGESYAQLVAQAYLPRTAANAELIAELDSGIKKEVSVGCAVRSVTCSVCGADLKNGGCKHARGQTYGGTLCCAVLDDPSDAYEWSFVAVPAQRGAGVLKNFSTETAESVEKSLRAAEGDIRLTAGQAQAVLAEWDRLKKEAEDGREYRSALKKDFLRCGALAQPDLPADVLGRAADALNAQDLKRWGEAFRRRAEKELPLAPQLAGGAKTEADGNEPFRI